MVVLIKITIFACGKRIGRESYIKTYYPLVSKRLLDPFAEHLGVLLFNMQENKIWKDVDGFDKNYQISNYGDVRIKRSDGSFKQLKPTKFGKGYLHINLVKNGKQKSFQIHRLVAEAFVSNPKNLPIINHKDENPLNNCVNNLEWCTYSYNTNYGTRLERYRKTCKQNHSTERFLKTMKTRGRFCAEKEVLCLDEQMNIVAEYKSVADGARAIGVRPETIRSIMRKNKEKGKKWKSYGFLWVYKEEFMFNKQNN